MRIAIYSDSVALHCYDGETDVLTRNGWKNWKDVDGTEEFATRKDSGEIEYQFADVLVRKEYSGKMYRLQERDVDLFVTANHRLFYKDDKKDDYKLVPAEESIGKTKVFVKSAQWNGLERKSFVIPGVRGIQKDMIVSMDDWLKFLGHYVAEGSSTEYNGTYTVQIRQMVGRHFAEMFNAAKKIFPNAVGREKDGKIIIRDARLYKYLVENVGRSHAPYSCRIPREFMELSSRQLKILWDGIFLGDGWKQSKGKMISTSSVSLRDDLQEMALKMGSSADFYVFCKKGKVSHIGEREVVAKTDNYRVSMKRGEVGFSPKKHREEMVDWKGMVYCVEVPKYHTLYVRRNGKAAWCGNTGYGKHSLYLARALIKMGHSVASFSLNSNSDVVEYKGIDVYPGATLFTLLHSMRSFKPDIMLHIRDNWVFIPKYSSVPGYGTDLKEMCNKFGCKLINYTPVQNLPVPLEFVESINKSADYTLITTKWGMEGLIAQGADPSKIGYLWVGTDEKVYRHFKVQDGKKEFAKGKKIIMFNGANMDYRKAIPLDIMTYKKYSAIRDDAVLYLHTNAVGGFGLENHIAALGLKGKVFFKENQGAKLLTWDLSEDEMAERYNMADAFITLTASEGFNEPVMEALFCGLPVVITDTPVHREVFGGFGDRVQFVKSVKEFPTVWGYEWFADSGDAAEKLVKALDSGKQLEQPKEAIKPFLWRNLASKFEEICRKVLFG